MHMCVCTKFAETSAKLIYPVHVYALQLLEKDVHKALHTA